MHISIMLVFWSLVSLVRNSVVLAVYLLLLKSGGFLCVDFADTSGLFGVDSASYAAVFCPLLLTTHGKANLAKFPGISFRVFVTEFDKNGRISSVLQ